MTRSRCGLTPWRIFCAGGLVCLGILVSLVIHRNVGAARVRRDIVPLIAIDMSPDPYEFTTEKLPKDSRFMPSIGNGHIATDIFSDTVYMNGLYNGEKGLSHRARVPAWCNVRLNSTLGNSPLRPTYTLDTNLATFFVHVEREWSMVDQRIYAHRYYTRAIVNQISITAKHKADVYRDHSAKYVELSFLPGLDSQDIKFESPQLSKIENRLIWSTCGLTLKLEDPKYQDEPSQVCAYWTHAPSHLVVPRRGRMLHTFVMTVDSKKDVALKEMIGVLQETEDDLFDKHKDEWRDIYETGRIQIGGNLELEKIVNGIWYYMLSSLPSTNTNQIQGLYYGLSPGGLSRGGLLNDYEGHNFWDTEFWMFPAILLLKPWYAESLLNYRLQMINVAADLAKETHHKGVRYPWESAFTGREVTQPCCPEVADYEHHITGCIAFAVRQYIAVNGSVNWLKKGGCDLIFRIADFWQSRAVFNETTKMYDIKNVMGPDEDHSNVTNSIFTNVVAGYSLYLGEYARCLCKNFTLQKRREWVEVAMHLALPYDPVLDYHPQFDGYQRPEQIKQADVTLLGFPLQYSMNRSTRANDLTYYESVTRESGPAMTWSMHSVNHLRIDNSQLAAHFFNKTYQGHVREPFKIWTEYKKPRVGSVNFLTGMGGFLQTIMFGYAGISIYLDRLEIVKPQVLPQSNRLKIDGLKYLGSNIILDIYPKNTSLYVLKVEEENALELLVRTNTITLKNGMRVVLYGEGPFIIKKKIPNECKLPLDLIGQPKEVPIETSN